VPSIGDPAAVFDATEVSSTTARTERVRSETGSFPQVVTNLWEILDAFCNLTGSDALDGAAGRRSSGDAAEAQPLPSCRGTAMP
jgi:hypothetical protein